MKIGILSDTHGVVREVWHHYLDNCDYLIHAGDIHNRDSYEKLKNFGIPIYFVRGNNDFGDWARFLPETLQVPIGGKIFYIVHQLSHLPRNISEADFIIFGHTHHYTCYKQGGQVFLNPGSAGQGRGESDGFAILEFQENSYHVEHILLN